ncbi:tol-pal system protein YbgF [Enhygromyxa salina]|uniref:Tol-pal system protein YbgF n=1 Tax=Enhygromyxa salina TaxID=215803 RepID=A0A2S9XNM9_9BACT|nr:tol-pal system protein YbgF [Enhygromyxa salina]PRP94477.1 tol-pal system protein YbgF [Enhygromyxa salina]
MPVQQRRLSLSGAKAALVCLSLPLLAAGCAANQAETEAPGVEQRDSEVAQLRRENAGLRTRVQNLEERVRLLEHGGADWGAASTSLGGSGYDSYAVDPGDTWAEPEHDGPRELPVVKLTPHERSIDRHGAVAQPTSAPRPSGSIALSPVPHSGAPEQVGSQYVVDARGGVDHDELVDEAPAYAAADVGGEPASYRLVGSKLVQATKRKSSTSKRSSDRDSGVIKDYKAAMRIYREGRYGDAEAAFAAIVRAHPNHDYADNALYWQGEAAYDQAHYADALAAFTKVVEQYGGGNKAPDALLKIGLCYGRLGDAANARDVLTQLVAAYPRAEASKIAKRKLADLGD